MALNAGRSRFTLATLPASEFPTIDEIELVEKVSLPEEVLRDLMERTAFAMANQDVRYYLNGMLLDLAGAHVALRGHRWPSSGDEGNPAARARWPPGARSSFRARA